MDLRGLFMNGWMKPTLSVSLLTTEGQGLRSGFPFTFITIRYLSLLVNIRIIILSTFRVVRCAAFSFRSQRFPESVLSWSQAVLRILCSSRRPNRSKDIRRLPKMKKTAFTAEEPRDAA